MPIVTDPSQNEHGPVLARLLLQMAGRLAGATGDPVETLQAILVELQTALNVDCIGLSLLPSGSDDVLKADHYHATTGPCPARELLWSEPSLIDRLRRGEIVNYPPAGKLLPNSLAAAGIGTILLLPLQTEARWVGTLGLATHRAEERWSKAVMGMLQTFGCIVAALVQSDPGKIEANADNAWLQMALEASGVDAGVWDLATGDFYTTFNVATQVSTNTFTPETEFTGYMQLVHPDYRERLLMAIESAINSEDPRCQVEYILVQPNGRRMWVEFSGRMRRDAAGAPRFIEGTLIDITQRKQMEQELNGQRQLLLRQTRLMEQSEGVAAIGGWEWDLVTDQLYFTPETYRIYGLSPDSPLPSVEDVVNRCTPESIPLLTAAMDHTLASGESYDLHITIFNTQGERVPVRTTGRVEIENGRAIRLYGVLQDVTHTVDLERKLRESRSAYSASSDAG